METPDFFRRKNFSRGGAGKSLNHDALMVTGISFLIWRQTSSASSGRCSSEGFGVV